MHGSTVQGENFTLQGWLTNSEKRKKIVPQNIGIWGNCFLGQIIKLFYWYENWSWIRLQISYSLIPGHPEFWSWRGSKLGISYLWVEIGILILFIQSWGKMNAFFFFWGGGGGGWRLGPLGGLPLCTPLARERGPDVCVMVVWVEGQVMAR